MNETYYEEGEERQKRIDEILSQIEDIKKDTILCSEGVLSELDSAEVYTEDGNRMRSSFLGSCFSLVPSGKYYMPFACSNLESCPKCEGKGEVPNPTFNKEKYEELSKKTYSLRDATVKQYGHWGTGKVPEERIKELDSLEEEREKYQESLTCDVCGGDRAYEAYLDELWWEKLTAELEELSKKSGRNLYTFNGEGDPCDIFIGETLEEGVEE